MSAKQLFGTDGIRAIAGQYPLDNLGIEHIARCTADVFLREYSSKKILLGRDTRASGENIVHIMAEVFCQAGYEVLDARIFPTAGIAYLCREYHCPAIVITASHNPYQFNGIKFFGNNGEKIADSIEKKIEKFVFEKKQYPPHTAPSGKIIDISSTAEGEYIHFLEKIFHHSSSRSLLLDCCNGSTYSIAPKLFTRLFPKAQFINTKPDGKNINDHCGALYPESLKRVLPKDTIGIAFDGDGDRVIFMDENGNVRDGDDILAVLATEYSKQGTLKNNLVIPTVMSNLGVLRYFEKKKIKTILSPVGDRYVYRLMQEHGAMLGGEQSGHIILRQYLPVGDGLVVALEILSIVEKRKKRLVELCEGFEKYPQVLKNIEVTHKPSLNTIFPKEMIDQYEKEIDGRILIRYSGTEPLLRIMVEGKAEKKIKEIAEKLEGMFKEKINYG